MSYIKFDVSVANGVVIDVANYVHPVWWMKVHPFRFNQSKSLLHIHTQSLAFREVFCMAFALRV